MWNRVLKTISADGILRADVAVDVHKSTRALLKISASVEIMHRWGRICHLVKLLLPFVVCPAATCCDHALHRKFRKLWCVFSMATKLRASFVRPQ